MMERGDPVQRAMIKAVLLIGLAIASAIVAVITGGSISVGKAKAYYRKFKILRRLATGFAIVSGLLAAIEIYQSADTIALWVYRQFGPSDEQRLADAIRSCHDDLKIACIGDGGAYGAETTLASLKKCQRSNIIRSDHPTLDWKDIWTTSVYSYQPGGGGPGGGRDDDVLKVGGWGDWYFSLIKFNLPAYSAKPTLVALALYSKETEGASEQMMLDQLVNDWSFPKGGTLWWRDRPGQRAAIPNPLPAPKRELWYVIDITDLFSAWAAGKTKNFGLQLRPVHEFGSFVFFASSDTAKANEKPRLILCF